ncbi:MarR family transcriptional regulator, partial [Staphylococcus arlettae]
YIVLLYIENNIPIYIKTLCEKLYLDSGTISPIIKRLEKKNLIQRTRTLEDERRVKVQLTAEGIELKRHFNKISEEVFNQFDMEEEDTRQYHKILKKFTQINVVENSNES